MSRRHRLVDRLFDLAATLVRPGVIEADASAHPAGSLRDAFGEDAACHEIVGAPVALSNQE
jgi:hypothetical protein